MPTPQHHPALGRLLAIRGDLVVFNPANTNYEIHLKVAGDFAAPLETPLAVLIHITARKVWTVPSGGNFIQPIFGPPRIVQGRVRAATETQLLVHAGCNFVVHMPLEQSAVELPDGLIGVNRMVNITAYPGATLELLNAPAPAGR